MSEFCSSTKGRIALVASVAANIFLMAFLLGQVTAPRPLPPPLDAIERPGMGFGHGMMFGPRGFFGAMDDHQGRMSKEFEQLDGLRKAFADQLKSGPVTKDQALEHFRQVDQLMDAVRSDARERTAEKISVMTDEDRARLATHLLEHRRPGAGGFQPGPDAPQPSSREDVVGEPAPVPAPENAPAPAPEK